MIVLSVALWIGALALALGASEIWVHAMSAYSHRRRLSPALLGFLVALGADGPEIASAVTAVWRGAGDVGFGVIIGSNIYNLAGLLGLSALIAGHISTGPQRVSREGFAVVVLTALLAALVLFPRLHLPLGATALLAIAGYAFWVVQRLPNEFANHAPGSVPGAAGLPAGTIVALALAGAVGIVAGSGELVDRSLYLGNRLHVSPAVVGTFILAVATSLPNTWAAVSLALRRHPEAMVATTLTSNAINVGLGAGIPALLASPRAGAGVASFEVPWLLGMTGLALLLLASQRAITRVEGAIIVAAYVLFVVLKLTLFG
jgi:cation:H+ antiporter